MTEPTSSDQYIAQVVAAYAAAEQYLLTQAAGILRRLTPTFEAPFLALSRLRTLVRGTVEKLAPFDEVARAGILQAALDGTTAALVLVGGGSGSKNPPPPPGTPTPAAPEPFNLSMPHGERAAQAIADDVVSSLQDVRRRITRLPDDIYKLISPQAAMGQVLDNNVTPEQAQAVAWRAFTERGITGFVDRSGRNWSLSAYVEMSVRTAAQRAFNDSHLQTMRALGVTYFTVPKHGSACPLCWPWQGAVLVETMPEHPEIPVDGTIAEAVAAGLYHPQCRHGLTAVFPGVTVLPERTPWTEVEQAEYDASQKQRALERAIRRAKQAQRDALTPEARKKAITDLRKAQARIREHVSATGRARDSRREQLNLRQDKGTRTPGTGVPRPPKPPRPALDSSGANEWDAWRRALGEPPQGAEATNNAGRATHVGNAYWAQRQALLAEQYALDFGNDKLNGHEIEFYERFLAEGHRIAPIKTAAPKPTPDFRFHISRRHRPQVEVKAVLLQEGEQLDVRRLLRPVRSQVIKILKYNREHPEGPAVMPWFIVDLRDEALPSAYRAELLELIRSTGIPGLWVYAKGTLIPISAA